jgi:hypothetical protein
MKMAVFWNGTPSILVRISRHQRLLPSDEITTSSMCNDTGSKLLRNVG